MRYLILPDTTGPYMDADKKTYHITELSDTAKVSGPIKPITAASEADAAKQSGLSLIHVPLSKTAIQAKLKELALASEAPVTVSGMRLLADAPSQSQFNNLVTLLQLARDAQPDDTHRAGLLATPLSAVAGPVVDADGGTHDMSIADAFALVLAYGQAVGAARAAMVAKQAAVRAAKTLEELAAI